MNLHFKLVSFYLVTLILHIDLSCWQVCAESVGGGGGDGGSGDIKENSVEEQEKDQDDELITKLLDTPIGNPDEESEVSRILKILEAAEQATSTTTSTTTTTTTPKPTLAPKPTTTTSSPFFKTERPFKHSPRFGKPDDIDEMIAFLDKSFKEAQQELGDGNDNTGSSTITKRSDYHHHHGHHDPSVNRLLWGTAQAVWDVSRPILRRTTIGRTVGLARDTLTLPLRTFGAIRHRIHDLTHHPYGYDRKHRSIFHGWGDDHHHHNHHDDHHHGHGGLWGWDSDPVYVKYEPENGLFKAWLRYLYRAVRPVVISKIRLKRHLFRIKLRFIGRLIHLLKSVKLHKIIAAVRSFRERLRPNVVVLKDTGYHHGHHHHHHGWGWPTATTVTHSSEGWIPGPPPTTTATPKWKSPTKWRLVPKPKQPTYAPISYGPPANTDYYGGYQHKSWSDQSQKSSEVVPPKQGYGPPQNYGYQSALKPSSSSPLAYNNQNTYSNYRNEQEPAQWLMAPNQMLTQASEDQFSSSSSESAATSGIEVPSYAQFLQQFGINPSSLADTASSTTTAPSTLKDAVRNLRQSENSEDVPYLISESSTSDDDKTARMDVSVNTSLFQRRQ